MPLPYNNLRSKLDRAICAYLIAQGVGTADDVSPWNSVTTNTYPLTTVHSTISKPEVNFTGNRRISVQISIKGSAANATNNDDPDSVRAAFDARVAETMDALMQTDDEQTLNYTANAITAAGRALATSSPKDNADMADFTLMEWYESGEGDGPTGPDEEACAWNEILMFDAVCCASALG